MKIINKTDLIGIEEKVKDLIGGYDSINNLTIRINHIKKGAKTPYSGICYYTKDKIRASINPNNKYPLKVNVGSPFKQNEWEYYNMESPEELVLFIVLHEVSHYLDHKHGIPVRGKQTKADKFALWKMGKKKDRKKKGVK